MASENNFVDFFETIWVAFLAFLSLIGNLFTGSKGNEINFGIHTDCAGKSSTQSRTALNQISAAASESTGAVHNGTPDDEPDAPAPAPAPSEDGTQQGPTWEEAIHDSFFI